MIMKNFRIQQLAKIPWHQVIMEALWKYNSQTLIKIPKMQP